jgi:hypothetical protein
MKGRRANLPDENYSNTKLMRANYYGTIQDAVLLAIPNRC